MYAEILTNIDWRGYLPAEVLALGRVMVGEHEAVETQ